jgi:hypothetical protein
MARFSRRSLRTKKSSLAARDIDVDVTQSVVTLTGKRPQRDGEGTGWAARQGGGVTTVNNRIEVDRRSISRRSTPRSRRRRPAPKAVDATANAAKKTETAVKKGVGKAEQGG